jgi:hypothetical protein
MAHHDQRRKRSYFKDVALQYWLDAVAKKHELAGLVLADEMGLLVASNLPRDQAEKVAGVALSQPSFLGLAGEIDGAPLFVHPTQVNRKCYYLCMVGDELSRETLELTDFGVQRILDEKVPADH